MRVAILDMYNNKPGQHGLRCIHEILHLVSPDAEVQVFDVRGKGQLPDLSFDLYISTGGPGDPREDDAGWTDGYLSFVDSIFDWNKNQPEQAKYFFAICHSFQMLCAHKNIGKLTQRKKFSFGVIGIHKTEAGQDSELLSEFDDVFYAADHRYFQVTEPDAQVLETLGAEILGTEEIEDESNESSIMLVSFSPYIVGTQFHPEVDVYGMQETIMKESIQKEVEQVLGKEKLAKIIRDINDPQKIAKMYHTMLPEFIKSCQASLVKVPFHEPIN